MPSYGPLLPSGYIPRFTDALIEKSLQLFGGLEICGTRWCGKSWSALAFGETITYADEALSYYRVEPKALLAGKTPHIIDEWQDVPAVWNVARHDVDSNKREKASYIFTGSSTPVNWKDLHSGAGRFSRVRMRTMTLAEQGKSTKQVSLAALFEHEFEPHTCETSLLELAQSICHGGWPELVNVSEKNAQKLIASYFDLLFSHSMASFGCNPQIARKVGESLARCDTTSAKLTTLAADVFEKEVKNPSALIQKYLEALKLNYFYEELPAWDAPVRSHTRLRKSPKRYIDDPSLTASLLHLNSNRLVKDFQQFGMLFESLCIHDLLVYASLLPDAPSQPLYYFATSNGLEVDVVIELRDGRWAALEIKLAPNKIEQAAASLLRLKAHVQANPAARNPNPEFLAIVLGTCEVAHQRERDGIYVFPLTDLTA